MFDNVMARRKVKTMSEKIGRFEYVKRGLIGACAATMLAGMCAVPAFAADASTTISGSNDTAATGKSTVNVEATINISATVPTSLPVSITNDGITAPSDFSIGNTTKGYDVALTDVKVSGKTDTNFSLSSTDTSLAENALYVTLSQKDDSAKKTVLTESSATGLNWTIGKSADGTTATPLGLKMDVKSGTLSKTFLSKYFTESQAFDVTWTIGLA